MYGNVNYGGYPYQSNSYGYGAYGAGSYQAQQPVAQQQSINTNKIYVNGIEDVRFRQLPAGSDYIFLDNDKPLVYRKTTDAAGKMEIQIFKIVPYQEEEKNDPKIDLTNYVSIAEFDELKQQFEELKSMIKAEPAKAPAKKNATEAKI